MDARGSCPRLPILTLAVRAATSYSRILRHTNLSAYPIYIYRVLITSGHSTLESADEQAPAARFLKDDGR